MRRSILQAVLLLLALHGPAAALESPPAQGSQLTFEKTLFVQQDAATKVFAESHQVARGDTLWQLLTGQYGISPETVPTFIEAFQQVNPEVDPDHLVPGSVIRVPFKVEERVAVAESGPAGRVHVVQQGESLWRILTNRYGVARDEMGAALRQVAAANPRIRDLDRLLVGQRIVIPGDLAESSVPKGVAGGGPLPPAHITVLNLLREMGCKVAEDGETFLPLSRGRTVRLDAGDFPLLTGPSGAAIILDPRSRLAPALGKSIEQAWDYRVVRGVDPDPEAQLARLLPYLGFQGVDEGLRTVALGPGASIKALARWTVLPRPEDLWEGRIHLLFSTGSRLDPALVGEVRRAGFRVHLLGSSGQSESMAEAPPPARLSMADPGRGAGELLGLLGVSHRIRPEVECHLGGGISYQLRPLLTFRHLGLDYAVPPATPMSAEAMLARAKYFTVPWPVGGSPMNLLADLLALLGVPHARTTVEVPAEGALRLLATGIVLESPEIGGLLYPAQASADPPPRVFLTEAQLSDSVTGVFTAQGLLPWVVDSR